MSNVFGSRKRLFYLFRHILRIIDVFARRTNICALCAHTLQELLQ